MSEPASGPGVGDRVRDLVEREGECCAFFTFTTTAGEDGIALDIEGDPVHEEVLDALAARLAAAPGQGRAGMS
ncbi:hypothetical protein ACGFZK_02495 [Streptomyces sp. NPDC048257]|uniref:hypothetical protein n=1 Tax=Streptomyces sp. NPDC048257 TaxID=3365526 RepID=UPI003713DFFC